MCVCKSRKDRVSLFDLTSLNLIDCDGGTEDTQEEGRTRSRSGFHFCSVLSVLIERSAKTRMALVTLNFSNSFPFSKYGFFRFGKEMKSDFSMTTEP